MNYLSDVKKDIKISYQELFDLVVAGAKQALPKGEELGEDAEKRIRFLIVRWGSNR